MSMSWLRNSSLTSSFTSKKSDTLPKNCDPQACVETFKKHWQQADEIIQRTHPPKCFPVHDDILGVVNNVGQMGTLLVVELESQRQRSTVSPTPCLEHLLSESMLNKLFEWSQHTGRFSLHVKQEQMRFYEKLVSRAGQTLLAHEPFVKPLLRLLNSCVDTTFSQDQEKQLISLLRQLCIALTHNVQLLDLFFAEETRQSKASFVPFTLLIPYVHRSGPVGQQARDALLLCMSLSNQHDPLGTFIAQNSHVCAMLATILSGLYSVVPRTLVVECEDWHKLTTDDVNELDDLTLFVNTLECCNAIVQDSHKLVQEHLIELITIGFLVPVMGTALLQETGDTIVWPRDIPGRGSAISNTKANSEDELIAATAYYELFLRTTTTPGLRPLLCNFLLQDRYEGKKTLNILLQRIRPDASPKLRIVTLSLLETLVGLNCEEVMHELVLQYLIPCNHMMLSQRARLRDYSNFSSDAIKLLSLSPIADAVIPAGPQSLPSTTVQGNQVYGLRPEESLYGNFHAYLCDARSRIGACVTGCKDWRYPYDGEAPTVEEETSKSIGGESSGYGSLVVRNADSVSPSVGAEDSPQSISPSKTPSSPPKPMERHSPPGGSHGDSPPVGAHGGSPTGDSKSLTNGSGDELANGMPPVNHLDGCDFGPFVDCLFSLVERMPNLSLQENLRITGVISRLAVYPHPLVCSLFLNQSLVFQPSIRTFYQVLRNLKESLEETFSKATAYEEVIGRARQFLLQREEKMASIRKVAVETPALRKQEPFTRGGTRRSLSSALSSVFRLAMPTPESLVENETPGSGYKYVRGRAGSGCDPMLWNCALCSVLMDEWVKELAALSLEHMLVAAATQQC